MNRTGKLAISELTIRLNPRDGGTGPVAGWASFVVNEALYLNNVMIRRHSSGRLTLSYPVNETPTATYPYFKPVCAEAGAEIERAVLSAFDAATCGGGRHA